MVQVLWLCGPSGVGKSTVGYALFGQLGPHTAYVDLDQLGLCRPAPADDRDNHRLKARNLGAVYAGFRAAGTRRLVVSGLVDDAAEVRRHVERLPGAAVTVCRLRVGAAEHRARFERRGWLLDLLDESVRNAADLDRTDFADLVVDTSGLPVPEVVAKVRASGWPAPAASDAPPRPATADTDADIDADAAPGGSVLFLFGPPAVGKSTVGFEVYLRAIRAGLPVAYVDLAQVGFCRPAPSDDTDHHRLKARNLGRVWAGHRAAGAGHLIVVGNVTDAADLARYRAAVPGAGWTACRLRAGRSALTARVLLRGRGGGGIMGDDLRGRSESDLRGRAADIARTALDLDRSALGDVSVDTDGRDVDEVADLVGAVWPAPG